MATKIVKFCETCGGDQEHWDNRTNKRNPKSPDFKCTGCGQGIWLPKAQPQQTAVRVQPEQIKPAGEQIKKEMIISYEKDIMVLAGEILKAEMAAGIHPADRVARVREIYGVLISDFRAKIVGKYFPAKKPTPPPPPEE